MKTVTVIDRRTGGARSMQRRYADLLVKLGHADYPRRDMQAEPAKAPKPTKTAKSDEDRAEKPKKRAYKRRDMQAEEE